MTRAPLVKPYQGEAGVGEVLVCEDIPLGKDFGMITRNRVMSLNDAVELLGFNVLKQYIESLEYEELPEIQTKAIQE